MAQATSIGGSELVALILTKREAATVKAALGQICGCGPVRARVNNVHTALSRLFNQMGMETPYHHHLFIGDGSVARHDDYNYHDVPPDEEDA